MQLRLVVCSTAILLALSAPVQAKFGQDSSYAADAGSAPGDPNRARIEAMLTEQQSMQKRNEELYERTERLVQRREKLTDLQINDVEHHTRVQQRFEKIMNTWEKQQAQYQRYLDALPKK